MQCQNVIIILTLRQNFMLFAICDSSKVLRNLRENIISSLQVLESFSCKSTATTEKDVFHSYLNYLIQTSIIFHQCFFLGSQSEKKKGKILHHKVSFVSHTD